MERKPLNIPWHGLEEQNPLDKLEIMFDHLSRSIDLLIQMQQNKLKPLINVRESRGADTTIALKPYSQNREKIRTILFQCTSSATLSLGSFVLTGLPAGVYLWPDLDIILDVTDARSLVQASSGQIALSLTGESLADIGIMP